MKKYIYRFSYYFVCALFIIALIIVVVFRDYMRNDLAVLLINYGFWYCFGLFSGFSLAIFIYKRGKTKLN
jgi:hypothetical protein